MCVHTLCIPVVFGAFLAVTNCVSPGLRGLAAASPNRVTKRVAADFYLAKFKNQKGVSRTWPGSTVFLRPTFSAHAHHQTIMDGMQVMAA
jgi:hypothetical protein